MMIRKLATAAIVMLGFLTPTSPSRGDAFSYSLEHTNVDVIGDIAVIHGYMDSGLSDLVSSIGKRATIKKIVMYGQGGNFLESVVLSSYVRERNIDVIVPSGYSCMSSCAFVAISSPHLTLDGVIALHSPFIPREIAMNMDVSDLTQSIIASQAIMLQLLESAGFSSRLFFVVSLATDPDSAVVFKSVDELNKYRVGGYYDTMNDDDFFEAIRNDVRIVSLRDLAKVVPFE